MVDYGGNIAGWLEISFASAQSNPIYYVKNLRINNSILTSLNIPTGVDTVKSYAFINDTSLMSLTLSNTIVSINDSAFCSCSAIAGPIMLPENITTIGKAAFANCKGLTGVLTIPESVTYIGSSAFSGCRGLTTVNFNAINCTTMGSSSNTVFSNCSSLTTLSIGNNVQTIPNYAFSGCRRLSGALDIPNSVISIGIEAFYNCDSIPSLNIGNSVTTIGGYAFYMCKSLPSVVIPNQVTSLGYNAFCNCTGLTSVTLGNSLTTIGDYCFSGCTGLTSMNIPNSVTSIGGRAFYGCSSMSSLIIGNSVSSIGTYAFNGCSVLLEIHSKNPVPPTLGNNVFYGVATSIPVYIPCGRTALYSYNWSYFSNFIETSAASLTVVSADNLMGTAVVTTAPSCTSPVAVVTAYPSSGYQFDHWSDGSTANPYSLNVTDDLTLTAYFSLAGSQPTTYYTITAVSADPSMGSVTGGGSYASGTTATLTASANSGYHFTHWQDNITNNPRNVTVTGNATYTAYFESDGGGEQPSDNAPSIACVGVDMNGHNVVRWEPRQGVSVVRYNIYREGLGGYSQVGYVNATNATEYSWVDDNSNTATQAYSYKLSEVAANGTESDLSTPHTTMHLQISQGQGTTWNLSWTPYVGFNYSGYRIYRGISSASMSLLTELSSSATTYSDNNAPSGNVYYQIEVVASSAKSITASSRSNIATSVQNQQFTITVLSDNTSMGTVTGGGTFAEGTTANISATPLSGYTFTQWSDGSTQAQRTITVTGNATYTAYFAAGGSEPQQYLITVVSNNPDRGTVTGGGLYDAGAVITITAEPFAGHEFVKWQDGNTEDFRTITVTADATYTAYFRTATEGIDDVEATDNIKIYTRGNTIVIDFSRQQVADSRQSVVVYDVMGRVIKQAADGCQQAAVEIPVTSAGVYMVKVGERTSRKVVVR